jgi:hypothetical protein
MLRSYRKFVVAVGLMAIGLGALRTASAAPVTIANGQSTVVDGWEITAPTGVSLTITTSPGLTNEGPDIDIVKAVTFTTVNESFQVSFQPAPPAGFPFTEIDFTSETVVNDTGAPITGFDFVIQNGPRPQATFDGTVFDNPIGPTPGTLTSTLANVTQTLSYTGDQPAGTTANWGASGPILQIDAPAAAEFTLSEVSIAGSVVPAPAAAWQSLIGLTGLCALGLARQFKLRRLARPH